MDRPGLGDGRTEIKHLGETAGGPGLKGPRLRSLIRQSQTVRASLCLNGNLQMENQACFVVHRQFVVKEAWRLVVSWFQLSALTRRTIRVRPAISLADSILQTASIARCVSVAVTATDHNILDHSNASRDGQVFALEFSLYQPSVATFAWIMQALHWDRGRPRPPGVVRRSEMRRSSSFKTSLALRARGG
jgi:hypothetical protein